MDIPVRDIEGAEAVGPVAGYPAQHLAHDPDLHKVYIVIFFLGGVPDPGRRIRHFFPRIPIRLRLSWNKNPGPEKDPAPDPTGNRNEEKIYLYFR